MMALGVLPILWHSINWGGPAANPSFAKGFREAQTPLCLAILCASDAVQSNGNSEFAGCAW